MPIPDPQSVPTAADPVPIETEDVSPASGLDAPIKLVIWDLDETFWGGTLSEEAVFVDAAHADVVRELNRRGIVNSICSKNDFEQARLRLASEDLWDEFVFPSISWSPKGTQIAQIIEDMQLRPVNVLFLDDNIGNLQEARHYVPGIQTAGPELIDDLLTLPQLKGKDDRSLSRLQQYRLLERKTADRAVVAGSNDEFLRSCDIRVELDADCAPEAARIEELINRTNQLNFTKHRMTEAEFRDLIADEERDTGYVRVRDRYGDYGVCGFYSVRDGRLTDFVFSCRILHMGVEQWLHAHLGHPRLEIVGDVATSLEEHDQVDWISLVDHEEARRAPKAVDKAVANARIMLKGGCDLWLVHDFLDGSLKTEFTYPSSTGADVRGDHTEVLRQSAQDLSEFGLVIDRLPFLDRAAYASKIVSSPQTFGTVMYSVLMDYTQGLYRLADTDFVVPYGQYDEDVTDPANWPYLKHRWAGVGVDDEFLRWFAENFKYEGGLTPEKFQSNIRWLAGLLPVSSTLILINGAEVPVEREREVDRHLHHRRMNLALDEVVAELPNAAVCDVRKFVASPEDITDNIRHYNRQTYLRMAAALTELVKSDLDVETRSSMIKIRKFRRKVERRIDRLALRLQHR
jgi:FkbH-like protein